MVAFTPMMRVTVGEGTLLPWAAFGRFMAELSVGEPGTCEVLSGWRNDADDPAVQVPAVQEPAVQDPAVQVMALIEPVRFCSSNLSRSRGHVSCWCRW